MFRRSSSSPPIDLSARGWEVGTRRRWCWGRGRRVDKSGLVNFFPPFGRRSRRLAGRVFKKKKKKSAPLSPLAAPHGRVLFHGDYGRASHTVTDIRSDGRTDELPSSLRVCFSRRKDGRPSVERRPFSLPSLSSPPLQPLPDLFCLFPILSSHGWRARGGAASFVRSCQTLCVRRNLRLGDRPAIDWRPVTFPLTLQSVKNDSGRRGGKNN